MMRKAKHLCALLLILLLPGQVASAAAVSFSNFSYTTTPLNEAWQQVKAKTKADNEQNWYATITGSYGLDATKYRAYLTSHTKNDAINAIAEPAGLKYSTKSIVKKYYTNTPAGSDCKLFIFGDENCKYSYTVKISGRYTS